MTHGHRSEEVVTLLDRLREGDDAAVAELFDVVYAELRSLAARQLARERSGHTLQPTALVHEAFLKLAGTSVSAADRDHFVGIAARAMRQVLVDHARRKDAAKRGKGWERTTLGTGDVGVELDPHEILDLDRAMDRLDGRQRRVVELRFFAGLEERDVARLLDVTERTVRRDWVKARAWLYAELYGDDADPSGATSVAEAEHGADT